MVVGLEVTHLADEMARERGGSKIKHRLVWASPGLDAPMRFSMAGEIRRSRGQDEIEQQDAEQALRAVSLILPHFPA